MGNTFLPESSEYLCPECKQGLLQYRDHCDRIVRYEGGSHEWIKIPRHRCDNPSCNRIHRMLPDILLPYKHYPEESISGVLDEIILPDDEDSENYPSEMTMDRWRHWLNESERTINSTLKSVAFRELDYSYEFLKSGVSLLNHLRESIPDGWLKVIIRFIYNSGAKLAAVY